MYSLQTDGRPSASSDNVRRRPGSSRAPTIPLIPQPSVFNPFWICCICCPNLSARIFGFISSFSNIIFDGLVDVVANVIAFIFGPLLIFLGPFMVFIALGIVVTLSYTFFTIILPMLAPEGSMSYNGMIHVSIVVFILINVLFNYYQCVTVKQSLHDEVVRELAIVTGFQYPETDAELYSYKHQFLKLIRDRQETFLKTDSGCRDNSSMISPRNNINDIRGPRRRTVAIATSSEAMHFATSKEKEIGQTLVPGGKNTPIWMLLGPQEWGYCPRSNQPKPPRSHYDGISKRLILNLDHYCPWTFNAVGYSNYRYFFTFILHVFLGMVYAIIIAYKPFNNCHGLLYEKQKEMSQVLGHEKTVHLIRFTPIPEERGWIITAYILVILTLLGVGYLLQYHLNLVLTGQTTIEERGNKARERLAVQSGKVWKHPYCLGWRHNWQMVFGSRHPLLAVLPSRREPEFLPLPVDGKLVRRGTPAEAARSAAKCLLV